MPSEQLADPDSKFIELNGLNVHDKQAGTGGPLIVLLHGFASNTDSWRKVVQPLSTLGTVVAYDRPAFGLTERPLDETLRRWPGPNPYGADAQADQLVALIEALGFDKAILVGNSAGGTIAMHTALRHPERVQGIVFVDPAIYTGGGVPAWLKPILRTPGLSRLGPLLTRNIASRGDALIKQAWHDPAKITPDDICDLPQTHAGRRLGSRAVGVHAGRPQSEVGRARRRISAHRRWSSPAMMTASCPPSRASASPASCRMPSWWSSRTAATYRKRNARSHSWNATTRSSSRQLPLKRMRLRLQRWEGQLPVQPDQTALHRGGHGFGPALHVELGEDVADVRLDGVFGEAELQANRLVAAPGRQQLQHL